MTSMSHNHTLETSLKAETYPSHRISEKSISHLSLTVNINSTGLPAKSFQSVLIMVAHYLLA